jgi:hypothetical protein
MNALVMALAAGLAVGNGPEPVSPEEAFLSLDGVWKGTWREGKDDPALVTLRDGRVCLEKGPRVICLLHFKAAEECTGKVRFDFAGDVRLGICKWEAGRLVICLGRTGGDRPTSFRGGDGQPLLTLRRIKPGK